VSAPGGATAHGTADRTRPLRFLLAGGVNTAVSFAVYAAMLGLGFGLAASGLASLLAGIGVGFVTQGGFVFRAISVGSALRYVLAWAVMYGVHLGVVTGLLQFGVPPLAGALVALVLITALSYFVLRDLVFRAGVGQTNKR
jgi:putative flippase GtrA